MVGCLRPPRRPDGRGCGPRARGVVAGRLGLEIALGVEGDAALARGVGIELRGEAEVREAVTDDELADAEVKVDRAAGRPCSEAEEVRLLDGKEEGRGVGWRLGG